MSQEEHFRFVKSLAIELNRKEIQLTSFPDVVMRVRKALDDPDTGAVDIANILSVDPVLASRVLVLANSSAHNPSGLKVDSLNTAIGRIGLMEVKRAAIAYAVEQLHAAKGMEALKKELRDAWSSALKLGAMSEAIAGHCPRLEADRAFIAGLLNQIGALYIFTKYDEYPNLMQDPEARQNLIDEWVGPIGECIVGNWKFSKDIRESVNPEDDEAARRGTKANLADVVVTAKTSLNGGADQLLEMPEARRLELTGEKMPAVQETYKQKLDSLASAVR